VTLSEQLSSASSVSQTKVMIVRRALCSMDSMFRAAYRAATVELASDCFLASFVINQD
jgi:hypothetical protein